MRHAVPTESIGAANAAPAEPVSTHMSSSSSCSSSVSIISVSDINGVCIIIRKISAQMGMVVFFHLTQGHPTHKLDPNPKEK